MDSYHCVIFGTVKFDVPCFCAGFLHGTKTSLYGKFYIVQHSVVFLITESFNYTRIHEVTGN